MEKIAECVSEIDLYLGTALAVPSRREKDPGFSPCSRRG